MQRITAGCAFCVCPAPLGTCQDVFAALGRRSGLETDCRRAGEQRRASVGDLRHREI